MTQLIDDLRASVSGRVIAPGDDDYDAARAVVLGGIDRRPAVIVRVADSADVQRVVTVARETGLELAVRSGGHSGAAHGTTEGGILLDVRDLRGMEIDTTDRSAWAGTGRSAGEYTTAAAEHGLATGFGDTGSVGLGGLVTGGGVGYLSRRYGLTIDSLLAAEVVTADGERRLVDGEHEPDLFWAIRGGGGNFGVVTRVKLRLHPISTVVGGMLFLPATREVVDGFVTAADAAPEELSTIANVMPCPPMPFVPAEHHGRPVVFGLMCWSGRLDEGEAVMAPFRALATPVADLVRPMPYPDLFPPDTDPDYRPLAVSRTMFMDTFDRSDAAAIVDGVDTSDAPMRVVQLRVLGKAVSRVAADATAYAHRDRRIMVHVASFYSGPEDKALRETWIRELCDALDQRDGAYVNFLGEDGATRIREAYPGPTWDRLAAVKARYDPGNLFRLNHNVPPVAG